MLRFCEVTDLTLTNYLSVKPRKSELRWKTSSCENYLMSHSISTGIKNSVPIWHSFFRQDYSWGRLLVTESTFAAISESCEAFPALRDYVEAFAFKTSDRDEHFSACDRSIFPGEDTTAGKPQRYHGRSHSTYFAVLKMEMLLTNIRNMLSPSVSRQTRKKSRLSVLGASNGRLPALRL